MSTTSQSGKSWSRQQRERGNSYYKSAVEGNFGPVVKGGRLDSALQCYKSALSSSTTGDEAVSAAKNVAMTTWKLASLHASVDDTKWSVKKVLVERNYREAMEHFTLAYNQGGACKSVQWRSHLLVSLEQCTEEILEWIDNLPEEKTGRDGDKRRREKIQTISELVGYLPDTLIKSKICLQLATDLFHSGVCALQKQLYIECYRLMKECYFPIEEAEKLSLGDQEILRDVDILREDVYLHTCIAESGKARATGDALVETAVNDSEELNVDLVWDIIDWYRQAAILCRTKDIEQEAIAHSRLGRVYDKLLNMSARAKDYSKKAIELALSMAPRNFHGVAWFEESTKVVDDFQRRLNKDGEENKEKDAALLEMKEDVDKLKALMDEHKPAEEFVKTLYETWPPKAPGATFKENMTKKKVLIRAISHYHPDRVSKEIHGKNWHYFSAEITKMLNKRYTQEKFLDDD